MDVVISPTAEAKVSVDGKDGEATPDVSYKLVNRQTRTHNAPSYSPWANRKGGLVDLLYFLILVDNDSINHHVVACANVVNTDRSADFHSRLYNIFIEHLTASRHVSD